MPIPNAFVPDSSKAMQDAVAKPMESTVNHPPHYNHSNIECIDALEDCMTEDQFRGFLKGNVIKYLWRADAKGNKSQDSAKAAWYSDRLAKFEEKVANK